VSNAEYKPTSNQNRTFGGDTPRDYAESAAHFAAQCCLPDDASDDLVAAIVNLRAFGRGVIRVIDRERKAGET
jgi:hypothetical protein